MSTPAATPSNEVAQAKEEIRGPDLGPALKRDLMLQRVRAARKRLSPISGAVSRLR